MRLNLFVILTILISAFSIAESGSEVRNLASRTSLRTRGRDIRVEARRLAQKEKQVKELDQMAKANQRQGFHDVAEKHVKAKAEIEKSAKLNQDNLSVLSKKQQPSKMTRTSSGKQRIVPAIRLKQGP
ncbi:uncharacterized protein FA14DRAFT_186021 [Meira miltonrushii]|uniref:Uncharacterized protein n=1 Tax=Meira miltonrushii TaxID=1280837 RepID=A0A316V3V4_9BASI|nr:uncharacterized protein FA14DRAFT_186021 [Meira miltonrushii]PWN32239.1 hypothetical protein FA14DRAFT_186021 [Meira miltonrushii]